MRLSDTSQASLVLDRVGVGFSSNPLAECNTSRVHSEGEHLANFSVLKTIEILEIQDVL